MCILPCSSVDCLAVLGNMDTAPIFKRHIQRAPRPSFICTEQDRKDAWHNIHPVYAMSRARCGFSMANRIGYPKMLFVGDSNMYHLSTIQHDKNLYHDARNFISKSNFVSCGGLKWWSAEAELNGVFQSQEKATKYGNQWKLFHDCNVKPDVTVLNIGANDTDDFHSHDYHLQRLLSTSEYKAQIDSDKELWLSQLIPEIEYVIDQIRHRVPDSKLYALPILPRVWWGAHARDLGNKLDHHISEVMRREQGINIYLIDNRSLFKDCKTRPLQHIKSNVIPGFYQSDNIHLNYWGFEALIRDLAAPVMDFVGTKSEYWAS